jgi:exopolyphosphatase/guanosine-5'-triphosphate,3'-diphosphate pyrophosphatase
VRRDDLTAVAGVLGRTPRGACYIAVRDERGRPVVLRNPPELPDGTPMPTLYWLVGDDEHAAVSRLEAAGGVKAAECEVPPEEVALAHATYEKERRRAADPERTPAHVASGGVGGTRQGVKCLHAHLAFYLAGGDDPVGRFAAGKIGLRRQAYRVEHAVAAVDCGTNSTRLLVLDPDGERLDRRMVITRLGAGVDRTGRLDDQAIERTVAVLADFRALMDHHGVGVGKVRASATSAAREARNVEKFLDRAEAVLGARPEVIPGLEEARLSYLGATHQLDPAKGPYTVVDVGGGSTELISGPEVPAREAGPADLVSLDVGCVRITERYLAGDPPTAAELSEAESAVAQLVGEAASLHPALAAGKELVGLAGTVSQLTMLSLGLTEYDENKVHHARLSLSDVRRFRDHLSSLGVRQRRELPGVEAARADVIVGGAIVLAGVMEMLGYESLLSSESDILDGMALGLLEGGFSREQAP